MKLISFILLVFVGNSEGEVLKKARVLLPKSNTNQSANEELLALTKNVKLDESTVLYAYNGAATMAMANHVYWPGTKLSYFNEGKKKLEKALNFDFQNVEIRFIRYAVQKGSPELLGYKDKMIEDKTFILDHLDETNWSEEYKKEVKLFLN